MSFNHYYHAMNNIRTLIILFENEISPNEITYFRGAVNAILNDGHSVLFHNHTHEGLRYSYPLIQYKRISRKAAIVCVEEGIDVVGEFLNANMHPLPLGNKTIDMVIDNMNTLQTTIQVCQNTFRYRLRNWLPFNSQNYRTYKNIEGIAAKATLMERTLVGNILSFLKGIGIFVEKRIECRIITINDPQVIIFKGVKLMAFDIEFTANISLPPFIGLGKGASVGYGTIETNNIHR